MPHWIIGLVWLVAAVLQLPQAVSNLSAQKHGWAAVNLATATLMTATGLLWLFVV